MTARWGHAMEQKEARTPLSPNRDPPGRLRSISTRGSSGRETGEDADTETEPRRRPTCRMGDAVRWVGISHLSFLFTRLCVPTESFMRFADFSPPSSPSADQQRDAL